MKQQGVVLDRVESTDRADNLGVDGQTTPLAKRCARPLRSSGKTFNIDAIVEDLDVTPSESLYLQEALTDPR
jgi:hypothetical protein